MKNFTVTLFFLLAFSPLFGKPKADPKDAKIDTLTKANKVLTLKVDSLSLELVKYLGVYTAIKEKVLHYNFDPTRASYIIDSLKASRDAQFAKLTPVSKSDSLMILMPKTAADSMCVAKEEKKVCLTSIEVEKARAISNLKQLKELLDAGIITEAEFISLKAKYIDKL
jgi:hypothetical protein